MPAHTKIAQPRTLPARQIAKVYARLSLVSTLTATLIFGFSCGVLAAILNVRSAAELQGDESNIMVPIATNGAISWVIASLFCVPFVLDKAFRRSDYINSCLAVIGWPIARQVWMLAAQFAVIVVDGVLLSYPVAVIAQWGVWRIPNSNGVGFLFPQDVHAPISPGSLAVAVSLMLAPLTVSFVTVLRSSVFGKIREKLDPKPVIVSVPRPRLLSGQSAVFVLALVCLWVAVKAGSQAGLFVILAFVLWLSWFAAAWSLPVARVVEKLLAKATPRSPNAAALSALLGEFHPSLRAVFVPLVYIVGVPAVLFSVSRTEALAHKDPNAGVPVWDFSVMLGAALLYVGFSCLVMFFVASTEKSITARYLRHLGAGDFSTRLLRLLAIPVFLLIASLAVAALFAFLASLLHALLLGSSAVVAVQGVKLGFSCCVVVALLVAFAVVGTCCMLTTRHAD